LKLVFRIPLGKNLLSLVVLLAFENFRSRFLRKIKVKKKLQWLWCKPPWIH